METVAAAEALRVYENSKTTAILTNDCEQLGTISLNRVKLTETFTQRIGNGFSRNTPLVLGGAALESLMTRFAFKKA